IQDFKNRHTFAATEVYNGTFRLTTNAIYFCRPASKPGDHLMKVFISAMLLIALALFPFRFAKGQDQSPQKPDEVLRIRSNEVRLDIVVKDRKGHVVKDLNASDFELLEDGVPQRIQSFRFVNGEGPSASNSNRTVDRKESKTEPSAPPAPPRATPG